MEELESVLENSSNGTVVTSRYFLQPLEELAKKHGVRAVAVDLNDFGQELAMLKELRPSSCVGLVSISPGILRAAEVILHSMRGNELLLMTATQTLEAASSSLRATTHVICDRPSLPLVEQTLRQNRSQLMRMPQIHCAESYLHRYNRFAKERNRSAKTEINQQAKNNVRAYSSRLLNHQRTVLDRDNVLLPRVSSTMFA